MSRGVLHHSSPTHSPRTAQTPTSSNIHLWPSMVVLPQARAAAREIAIRAYAIKDFLVRAIRSSSGFRLASFCFELKTTVTAPTIANRIPPMSDG